MTHLDDFASAPFPNDPQALFELALRGRTRRPAALEPLAQHMQRLAGEDTAAQGRAEVVLGWAQVSRGQLELAEKTATRADRLLQGCADPAVQALGQDLWAQWAHVSGRYEQAIAHGLKVVACPEKARRPQEWSATMTRLGSSHDRLGRYDEALRWFYRGLPFAAAAGDPVAHASVLGAVGGLQLSLLNVEEAAALCGQAWELVRDSGPGSTWGVCAINWAMVLMLQKRYAQAMPLADTILAADEALGSYNRHKRRLLLGELMAHAGQVVRAQQLLDQGLALCADEPEPPLDWVRSQATLYNAVAQPAKALELCQSALAGLDLSGKTHIDVDYDLLSFNTQAALAQEALGDLAGALASHRAALTVERRMGVAAMQARRLTMQIQSEVDQARRERDSALQRERDAALERTRLSELNAQLEEVSRAKSRFLAAASHDLRQPLHALGLQLAHLRSGVDSPAREAVEQRMENALGSLTHMFDTLLDMSRMDAGVLTPRVQPFALSPLLVRLVDELTPVAQARGLRLSLHLVGERFTETDPGLLETMLRNLLGNALKYTRHGGVLLALRDRAAGLSIEVWDSGVGIAANERDRVFEEFYQVGPAGRDRTHGLGLGLSIVHRLSKLLGHSVLLDSRPGCGTRFRVEVSRSSAAVAVLAAKPGLAMEASDAAATPSRRPQGQDARQGLCIGVIEDDPEVRESLAALLRRWGHRVHEGACAAELTGACAAELTGAFAAELTGACAADSTGVSASHLTSASATSVKGQADRDWRPDAVIADYTLAAGATGDVEVASLRRAVGWSVPALIVSGGTGVDHLRALSASGLPWLSKPLQPARLRAWLQGVCSAQTPESDHQMA